MNYDQREHLELNGIAMVAVILSLAVIQGVDSLPPQYEVYAVSGYWLVGVGSMIGVHFHPRVRPGNFIGTVMIGCLGPMLLFFLGLYWLRKVCCRRGAKP